MSIHPIPAPTGDLADSLRWQRLDEVRRLCRTYLREPASVTDDGTTLSLVFTPDLTASEQATLARLVAVSGFMRITPAEWQAVEGAIDTLRTYRTNGSPTAAQTVAATKAIIDVLRALLRD